MPSLLTFLGGAQPPTTDGAESAAATELSWGRWFDSESGSRPQLLKGNDDPLALLVLLDLDKSPLHVGPL